jgi:cytoskeletal protein CcmA (bactofilin family)
MIWRRDDEQGESESEPAFARPNAGQGGKRMAQPQQQQQQNGEVTIVGQQAKLEGTLVSAGSLRVDGQVKGQINADGDVILSAQSNVEANINAANVSVAGRFKGDINVKGTAELARGGKIEGNITSKTLVIQEGGIFTGQSIMGEAAAAAPAGGSAGGAGSSQEVRRTVGPGSDQDAQEKAAAGKHGS